VTAVSWSGQLTQFLSSSKLGDDRRILAACPQHLVSSPPVRVKHPIFRFDSRIQT
jgi:hypothetical protein